MDFKHIVENLGRDLLDFPAQSTDARIIDKNVDVTCLKKTTAKCVDICDVGDEDGGLPALRHNLLGRLSDAFGINILDNNVGPPFRHQDSVASPQPATGTSNQHPFIFQSLSCV